jgi:hypothetical protein
MVYMKTETEVKNSHQIPQREGKPAARNLVSSQRQRSQPDNKNVQKPSPRWKDNNK